MFFSRLITKNSRNIKEISKAAGLLTAGFYTHHYYQGMIVKQAYEIKQINDPDERRQAQENLRFQLGKGQPPIP